MKLRKALRRLAARQKDFPDKASVTGDWSGQGGRRHAYKKPGSLKK